MSEPMPQSDGQPFENIVARITPSPSPRIETREYVIHQEPRISANKLAEYIVSDPSRQKAIAKDSKKAPKAIMLPYKQVRQAVSGSFSSLGLNREHFLSKAEQVAENSQPGDSDWQKGDAERSAKALKLLAELAPRIECANAERIHRPDAGWGHLMMAGVRVSVQPELVFSFTHRNITKVGGVILNTGQGDEYSLSKGSTKHCSGDYLAALVYMLLEARLTNIGAPLHSRCYAVDIFRSEIYSAPKSFKTLKKHIEATCEMIALRWPTLDV